MKQRSLQARIELLESHRQEQYPAPSVLIITAGFAEDGRPAKTQPAIINGGPVFFGDGAPGEAVEPEVRWCLIRKPDESPEDFMARLRAEAIRRKPFGTSLLIVGYDSSDDGDVEVFEDK